MSEFDDVLIPNSPDDNRRRMATDRDEAHDGSTPTSNPPRPKTNDPGPKSLVELLTGSDDTSAIATKLNLDPDLSERIVIPLINLLDKYGLGESIAESPTARASAGLMEFLGDISPVVRSAADYVNGKRKELSDEDREFLDKIRSSQELSGDMSLFLAGSNEEGDEDDEDEWGDVEISEPTIPQTVEGRLSARIQGDPFADGVNWENVLEPLETAQEDQGLSTFTDFMPDSAPLISGLEDLAREQGLDPKKVMAKDSQRRINRGGHAESGHDYTEGNIPTFDLGVDEISAQMKKEKNIVESRSQVKFDELPTPQSATDYIPTKGQSEPPTPTTTFSLPSINELMADAGASSVADGRNPTGSFVAEPEQAPESPEWDIYHSDPEEPTLAEEVVATIDSSALRGHQKNIFEAIYDAGSRGLSDEEGQNLLLVDGSSYRPARKRLVESGFIISNATRENHKGNRVKVWVAVGA